ncbi:adenosylcobinamide-phosphate synthase CbiB [Halorhabdus rudnickae]|uniref:adenosylcobinamide-phosphate synthase CbiB n=1 Tax=Halorhabdus rudnickae TaxID=1775544 RepID=UPI0010832BEA|nr:adenosylcobinamide-phosphate synthase CbiB [Halorhabdus rudnickae]
MSTTVAIGGLAFRVEPPLCVLAALALDAAVGEAPESIHPVALFGRAIAPLDREWPTPRLVGVVLALLAPTSVAVLALVTVASLPSLGGPILATGLLFSTISLRRLLASARAVIDASETSVEQARESIPALVGRDPDALSPAQLRSGAVESLAENLADGFVAPLGAFVLGTQLSLSVGVAAAVWVKALNTLDSMLGYRAKPIGWASARLDDLVMWIPARLTAVLIAVAARDPSALWHGRRWRDAPPSPNSGWPMATLAAVLDVRLEKPGVYVLNPNPSLPDEEMAVRAVRVVALAGALAGLLAALLAGVRIVPDAAVSAASESLPLVTAGVRPC